MEIPMKMDDLPIDTTVGNGENHGEQMMINGYFHGYFKRCPKMWGPLFIIRLLMGCPFKKNHPAMGTPLLTMEIHIFLS